MVICSKSAILGNILKSQVGGGGEGKLLKCNKHSINIDVLKNGKIVQWIMCEQMKSKFEKKLQKNVIILSIFQPYWYA